MAIKWELIISFAGWIVLFYNCFKAVMGFTSPIMKIKKKLEEHDAKLQSDFLRINEIEKSNNMICKSMLALMDHEITGNSIEKLKTTRADLQNFLIERR